MSGDIVRLKIVLTNTEPPIWRRVEVPAETTLKQLHAVIQAVMGWDDDHLHQFQLGRQNLPARVGLDELAAGGVKRFTYFYDMGDSWEHRIQIEKRLSADSALSYPRFVDGAMRCPPEDVGGIPGFYEFLEAIADPNHPDHEDRLDWYGGLFDPKDLEPERINKDLARLAAQRKRAAAKRGS
jgi:Plasmid pRiA4b ORF-3-like protein